MAESTVIRTKRDGQIVISDSGASHSYTVSYEPGDFTFDIPDQAVLNFLDRGSMPTIPSIRLGDDAPMTGGFSAYMRDICDTAGTPAYTTLLDLIVRFASKYTASNWTSTIGAYSDVTTWTIAWTVDGSAFGESDKTLTFSYSVLRAKGSEGDGNKVDVTFTSYARIPTVS